jgi:hypothetical protein
MQIVNMSVWESTEALRGFVYRSHHAHLMRDRLKWFEKMSKPYDSLWWVPLGHAPTVAEGRRRLDHYQQRGATRTHSGSRNHFPHLPTKRYASSRLSQ